MFAPITKRGVMAVCTSQVTVVVLFRIFETHVKRALRSFAAMQDAVKNILSNIKDLEPQLKARVMEFETARRIAPDVIASLKSIGILRMLVPRSHGGLELDLPSALDIVATIARIDGSLGWTAMIGSGAAIFAPLLPRKTFDDIYRNGPDVIVAGSTHPVGTAEATADGWLVSGRWPFASGCQHADFLIGVCVMMKDGEPVPAVADAGGPLATFGFIRPACDWQIEDTWHASGLKGTGSHHVAIKDVVVPVANTFDLTKITPCVPGPLYGSLHQILPMLHSALAIGIAEAALDAIVAHANTGRQQTRAAVPMRQSETFQAELGRVAADVRAARAFFESETARYWRHALAGTLNTPALQVEATQGAIWLTTTCIRAADACFALGGGAAVYDSSSLQRHLRDLQVAGQHAAVHQRHYVNAGKMLLQS
jgi:alkylation response protein AidB-like acyl-CoA dehydrogenase